MMNDEKENVKSSARKKKKIKSKKIKLLIGFFLPF